jgi:hypothetical protein
MLKGKHATKWIRWLKGLICCLWVWVTMGCHFGPLNDSPNLFLKNINPWEIIFAHQKNSKHISSWLYAYIRRRMKCTIGFEQAIKISKHLINIHEQYRSSRIECINLSGDKSCQKLWQNFEHSKKKQQRGTHSTYAIEVNNKIVNYLMPKF